MATTDRKAERRRGGRAWPQERSAKTRTLAEKAARGPGITPEERLRLAECCAFFKAEVYREAWPGKIRASDVEEAKTLIDAVIENNCGARREPG